MRILVTGGAGYVGSVTVEVLQEAGHDVVVLDDLSTGHRAAVVDGVVLHIGSYGDPETLARLLDRHRMEAVLHCAAKSQVAESVADPAKYYRENVAGGIVLLEGMRLAGVRRIVFSSTAAVYGKPERMPITEDQAPAPISPYGETKRTFEEGLRWYGQAYGLRSVIFRYFNVAGASPPERGEPFTRDAPDPQRLAAAGGGELTLFGDDFATPDGTCIRDYIHVLDLAPGPICSPSGNGPRATRGRARRTPLRAAPVQSRQRVRLQQPRGYHVAERVTVGHRPLPFWAAAAWRSGCSDRPARREPESCSAGNRPTLVGGDGRLGLGVAVVPIAGIRPDKR